MTLLLAVVGFALDGIWIVRRLEDFHDAWNSPWHLFAIIGLSLMITAPYRQQRDKNAR